MRRLIALATLVAAYREISIDWPDEVIEINVIRDLEDSIAGSKIYDENEFRSNIESLKES